MAAASVIIGDRIEFEIPPMRAIWTGEVIGMTFDMDGNSMYIVMSTRDNFNHVKPENVRKVLVDGPVGTLDEDSGTVGDMPGMDEK